MPNPSQTMFQIWTKQADTAYDMLLEDMRNEIIRMRALGISDEEIYSRLTLNLNGKLDMFSKFVGNLEGSQDSLFNTLAQIFSNEEIRQDGAMYTWQLDPTITVDHCEDCLRNSKEAPMTYEEWVAIGLPGMGNTECGDYCKCTLMIAA